MSVNPVASKGVVALNGVKISKVLQLVKGLTLPVSIDEGEAQTSFNYDFSLPKTVPTLAIKDFTFSVRELAGKLAQGGDIALAYAALSAPTLHFVKNEQSTLRVDGIELSLKELLLNQQGGMQLTLKESAASLPQFNFSVQETPQLAFEDLNLHLSELNINQNKQFSLALPQTDVKSVSADLAGGKVSIKEVMTSDMQFNGREVTKQPLATLSTATIEDSLILLQEKKVSVQSILFSGLETSVIKQADNKLNWVSALESQSAPKKVDLAGKTKSAEAGSGESAWQVALAKVALSNGNIHIQDKSVPTPVVMDVVGASVEIQNASLDMAKALPVKAAFKVKQGGQFSTKGTVRPSPFSADLGLRLSQLSLKPFAPYLNQIALLKLKGGAADVSGKLHVEQKRKVALNFNGQFDVKRLNILEEVGNKPFLSWDHLRSKRLKVSLMPNKLSMSTLQVVKPSGKFIINPDKSINLTQILRSSASSEKSIPAEAVKEVVEKKVTTAPVESGSLIKAAQTAVAPKPEVELVETKPKAAAVEAASSRDAFPVNIDAIRLSDAKLEFADLSLKPQFGTNIHSLNGVINGFSTKAAKVAQLELDGKVDEYGSARISGSLQPLNATGFMDIKLAFVNLDMNRLTPYSGKFAGRKIDSGKLSVDLEYKIKQNQLAGTNKFVINKLKLGEKVDSADAADLPLDLAIAILEDSDGVIDLDLPISGSLDDPAFSYGGIFWKAFRNVMTKIVTAPFRVLGKLFGGDGEDFDGILFDAGADEIPPPELEKLSEVSEALGKRQALSLGIVPTYNLALDTQAIKQATYRQQVAEEMDVELEVGQKPGPVDLENEDAQDAVDTLYDKLTNKGLLKRMVSKLQKPEDGHYEKAQASLIESVEVTEADLQNLAVARAKAVKAALLESGVAEARVSILDPAGDKAGEAVKMEMTLGID